MAAVFPSVMAAGAVVSAMGSIQAGKAQKTAALYNAQQDEVNAQLSVDQSRAEAARFHTQASKAEGSMIAGFGASGLSGGTESVLAESVANARLDEELIKYKGRVQSMGFYNSATLNRFSARTATEQAGQKAAADILAGVGHAGSTYAVSDSRLNQQPSGYDDAFTQSLL